MVPRYCRLAQPFFTTHQHQTNKNNMKSTIEIVANAPRDIIKNYAAIVAKNAAIPLSASTAKAKDKLAREAAVLFAKDIEHDLALSAMSIEEALHAADLSDAQVGLLSGTLVLQRSLSLLAYEFPLLSAVTTDFSAEPGLFNQTENTRIVLQPALQTYNPATDAGGRPKGWDTASPAQTVDVPITLDEHVGVPIVFGVQTLGSTMRNLFEETAPAALYVLGKHMVNKITALMTAENFNAYASTSATAGATTSGSFAVTVTSTAGMYPGQAISGTGIPSNTYVRSVTDSTHAVLTQAATASNTGLTLALGGDKVPTLYATYAQALADFSMASLGNIKAAFDVNEVPMQGRFALLNAAYHQRLAQDPTFNSFFAATRKPEVITDGLLPKLQGFNPLESPWFPSSNNRVGFAGHKSSLIIKTRLPQDFSFAIGAMVPGSVTTVAAPGGFSVLLIQYINLQSSYAEWRPEVMIGASVGERRAGLVLTSQ